MTADKRHQHDCKAEVRADLGTQRELKTKHEVGEVIEKQTNFHLKKNL